MLWDKSRIIGFGILLPVFFSVLFVSPSYAISDISQTYSDGSPHVICASGPGWNGFDSCDGYNYLIFDNIDLSNANSYIAFNSSINFGEPRLGSADQIVIKKSFVSGDYLRFSLGNYSSGSYKVTLSANPPGSGVSGTFSVTENGTYEISQYEFVDVDVPAVISETPYDEKLDQLTKAVYVVPATLIVLYFFYCIYRIIIKNSGVNNL